MSSRTLPLTDVVSLKEYLPKIRQAEKPLKRVTAYVDGACFPNPGAGAYGVLLRCGSREKALSGPVPEERTTNQRAEIHAAVAALEALREPCEVTIVSDSMYLVETANGNYRRGTNRDLWDKLDNASSSHLVTYRWVRGHRGDPDNERAHGLAEDARRRAERGGEA